MTPIGCEDHSQSEAKERRLELADEISDIANLFQFPHQMTIDAFVQFLRNVDEITMEVSSEKQAE